MGDARMILIGGNRSFSGDETQFFFRPDEERLALVRELANAGLVDFEEDWA
jgi:hypothetical protein